MNTVEKFVAPERPAYRILDVAGFFGPDDTLHEYMSEVYFDGEPAVEMEPLNESARVKYVAFLEHLDDEARAVAVKLGRPFTGRPRSIDGALQIATAVQRLDMNLMGNKDKPSDSIAPMETDAPTSFQKRGRGRPRKLSSV